MNEEKEYNGCLAIFAFYIFSMIILSEAKFWYILSSGLILYLLFLLYVYIKYRVIEIKNEIERVMWEIEKLKIRNETK